MNAIASALLEQGAYFVVADFRQQAAITKRVRDAILAFVGELRGEAARSDLESRGLGYLHIHLAPEDIQGLRDRVMPQIRPLLFGFACEVGGGVLGLEGEFFVDDYAILRVNLPYEVTLRAAETAENPGIGRVDPAVRGRASSVSKRDERYDPKAYHKNTPPASWAHGPHKDTWTGHSRRGINIWWAIGDVVEENSMMFYPATFGKAYESDPKSLYIAPGYPLPEPRKMALHAGEALVFNPELLHGTHLNTSGLTRVALSARLNPERPRFDPGCFYAREFWHSSRDLQEGRFDAIVQFARDENLESAPVSDIPVDRVSHPTLDASPAPGGWESIDRGQLDASVARHHVRLTNGRTVLLLRAGGRWAAVQSMCPHLDVDLADGFGDGTRVFCPAHGVAFRLEDGTSSSPLLTLATYEVEEGPTRLRLRARPR